MSPPAWPAGVRSEKLSKVTLSGLVFAVNWEDPNLDRAALGIGPHARIATVCSGACNTFAFLLDDPDSILAFDFNPAQVWLLELKAAAYRRLDHGGMLELLGVRPSARRQSLLDDLLEWMSPAANAFWRSNRRLVDGGLLASGRYERLVRAFGSMLRVIQGRRRIRGLFEERDAAGRERFYRDSWDNWRWRLLVTVCFNRIVLARAGLNADYFRFADGTSSFGESFNRRARQVMTALPVRDNSYLAQYVLGRYLDEAHLPIWLKPENFDLIRSRIDRIDARVADVRDVFRKQTESCFDGICLSNVFELMSQADADTVIPDVARVVRPGGRVTLRNLMVPRSVPDRLSHLLALDEQASRTLHAADRSFVYRSFQVYTRPQR